MEGNLFPVHQLLELLLQEEHPNGEVLLLGQLRAELLDQLQRLLPLSALDGVL
jgi:hypothetical protein